LVKLTPPIWGDALVRPLRELASSGLVLARTTCVIRTQGNRPEDGAAFGGTLARGKAGGLQQEHAKEYSMMTIAMHFVFPSIEHL
jgi:hypothetical protein